MSLGVRRRSNTVSRPARLCTFRNSYMVATHLRCAVFAMVAFLSWLEEGRAANCVSSYCQFHTWERAKAGFDPQRTFCCFVPRPLCGRRDGSAAKSSASALAAAGAQHSVKDTMTVDAFISPKNCARDGSVRWTLRVRIFVTTMS
jgi:hypothetical protein